MFTRAASASTDRSSAGCCAIHTAIAQGLTFSRLRFEYGTELALAAGPAHEHDQRAGNFQGQIPAQIFFDQGERKVHAGGDSGGAVNASVFHKNAIRFDANAGVIARQPLAILPVSGGTPSVQQTGGGEDEGARADRSEAADARRHFTKPTEQRILAGIVFPGDVFPRDVFPEKTSPPILPGTNSVSMRSLHCPMCRWARRASPLEETTRNSVRTDTTSMT